MTAKPAALSDFYDPPIDAIEDRTPSDLTPTETAYALGWATDRDVEWLAAGLVTEAMQERAKTLLMWKNRYWQGMDDHAAAGAQELYYELVSYGLGVGSDA
jgi:hypothetical protein